MSRQYRAGIRYSRAMAPVPLERQARRRKTDRASLGERRQQDDHDLADEDEQPEPGQEADNGAAPGRQDMLPSATQGDYQQVADEIMLAIAELEPVEDERSRWERRRPSGSRPEGRS
jgi:hypothetical protein